MAYVFFGALVFCSLVSGQPATQDFAKLRSAVIGEWEAVTTRGSVIRVSYRAIAADSALVESFRAGTRETLTIYHPDGSSLIATHYCAQGNQPRLRLLPASDVTSWQFAFKDATNLPDVSASHLTGIRFQLKDSGHFDKTEVYSNGDKEDVTIFKFARIGSSGGESHGTIAPGTRGK
jgi:hypothetical protein